MEAEIDAEVQARVSKIVSHNTTVKKNIENWPEVFTFLNNTFPNVGISDVPIYLATPSVMNRNGFSECHGVFIHFLNTILVKNKIIIDKKPKGAFERELQKLCSGELQVEDIVVHELVHAVSGKVRGVGGLRYKWYEHGIGLKYLKSEEEFAYTTCVDFYKQKGMKDKDIYSLFLPYCIQDVMGDKKQMDEVCVKNGVKYPSKKGCTQAQYRSKIIKVFNNNANNFAKHIVESAKGQADSMIDTYNKYGRKVIHSNVAPDQDVGMRMATIDMDCDF